MRSSRAPRLLLSGYRSSRYIFRGSQRLQILRNGYCSACPDAQGAGPTGTAKAVTNPPTPPADHRQLAIEQDLYINSKYSPGSPLFGPNGARIFNKLTNFLRAQYSQFGFQEVITPTIYKKSLWEKSGHWENYKDDMYSVTGRGASGERDGKELQEDEEYGLKPMNCPGHCLIFASQPRSYREMPVRYADFSPLHRNENSGSLSGLTRVRRFHQDDGHIFCRPSQIGEEISDTLEFVRMVYQTLGLGPYRLTLSTRPKDSFIGTIGEWDSAEAALKKSLNESGQVWTMNEGDGAFYGPKIDIILKDSDGKEHQTATIQLDFQLPKRFALEYQAPAPELEKKGETTTDPELLATSGAVTPVLIHRAVLGSVERLMALLIEHYNGKYPFWLNPRQVIVITVNDEKPVLKYANSIVSALRPLRTIKTAATSRQGEKIATSDGLPRSAPIRGYTLAVDLDDSPRSVKKKISEAKRKRYSVIIVVGQKNATQGTLNVDLSGIPDPHGWIQKKAYSLCAPMRNGTSKSEEVLNSPLPDKTTEGFRPEHLKDVTFHGHMQLFTLLEQMEKNYI
ncbi:putative threonine-tRNA [Hyphodiscus hymeniophilus]|uniref:threonine--tRNA ligase n=1 Tax=Hyphodiscus hymeniophilus TaxID=353542 RepID=A0A9P6VQI9_9HELO|nr:putative threonine-tRNA [Hyphodiscus hymeniophilus]